MGCFSIDKNIILLLLSKKVGETMKIGLFTDTFLPVADGVGRVVSSYAYTLSEMGHDVVVSSPRYDVEGREELPFCLLDYRAATVKHMPQYRFNIASLDPEYLFAMRETKLEIAHAHTPFSAGFEAKRVAREKHIPLVATFHSKFYDDFLKIFKSETVARSLLKQVVVFFEKCDEVWAVSDATATVLQSYGYTKKPVVMQNGVSIQKADEKMLAQVEKDYQLESKPLLLFVGQMNWKKNILRVLEAVALLKKNGQDFFLILVGQGPDEEEIKATIKEMDIESHVKTVGHIKDDNLLAALYARATVFTFPSLYDNAPMVVREAAAVGTPSVLVRQSSSAEIIVDGVNGFLCDDDAEDLYRVLLKALNNPGETAGIGAKACQTIPVSWKEILTVAVKRYEKLAAGDFKFRKKKIFF